MTLSHLLIHWSGSLGLAACAATEPASQHLGARATFEPTPAVAEPFAAPAWGESDDPRVPTPAVAAGGPLRAGDRVVVRWPAARGIEEMELLVSVDGGRHYELRVSPELEGYECRYVWRVPNLGAADARIRIRARIEDREVEGPPSASFAIVAHRRQPAESALFREGVPWDAPADAGPSGSGFAPARASLRSGGDGLALSVPERVSIATPRTLPCSESTDPSPARHEAHSRHHSRPRLVPLRI